MRFLMVLLAALLLAVPLAPFADAAKKTAAPQYSADAQKALEILNAWRKANGAGQVWLNPQLTAMAQELVNACLKAGTCDHNTGGSYQKRAAKWGFANSYGGENLALGAASIDQAFAQWKASKVHNSNMLIPQAIWLGFARAPTKGAAFWVLIVSSNPL